jgi:arsenite/tail-anchored protein-transporting ATPase
VTRLDPLLERLPRTTLVVGKGGVGKTTCATLLAKRFAERGDDTLLLSTDPAAALGDVLGAPVSGDAAPIEGTPHLFARQLDAATLRRAFLDRWRDTLAEIVDRGTYIEREDVEGLVDAALPGADEIFALLALADLLADLLADPAQRYSRIVVDTAPTGHTLRLLALPETFRALLAMLDAMQNKHRFMVRALTHRYRRDTADEFLDDMRRRIDGLRLALANEDSLAAVIVTRAEPVVEAESRRYVTHLRELHVRVAGVIVNAGRAGSETHIIDAALPHYWLPFEARESIASKEVGKRIGAPVFAPFTIVGGKGGVGKSTVATALAIAAADATHDSVLLVSTDPAPSIADALGATDQPWARVDEEHAVDEVPGLVVRQLDAAAAFARMRDEYQSRIDNLFDALTGRGVDFAADHAILRDLLALAPPGIDELFALSSLGDALAEHRFTRIIVDPAPTGHLLRLLDMPAIALDWTHRLMRLMLKYRDVTGLGDTAQELLAFAKRTRVLETLLRTPAGCTVVIVALDEPVVRAETARLAGAIASRHMDVAAIIWNRVTNAPEPLPAALAPRQFFAEETSPPPVGVDAVRTWSRSWRELPPISDSRA